MSLSDAFNAILRIQSKAVTLHRPDGSSKSVYMAPSNFFRQTEMPSDITVSGREFIISKEVLDASGFGKIKLGDKITTDSMGTLTIDYIREMYDVGGDIIGYRLRTN